MCEHGNTVKMLVPNMPNPTKAGTGEDGFDWEVQNVDRCLAPTIGALNSGGIYTVSCCCGHGESLGHIWLRDGRILIIIQESGLKDDKERLTHIFDTVQQLTSPQTLPEK
jgi:hypothetical protein